MTNAWFVPGNATHDEPDQIKRRLTAEKIKACAVKVDTDMQTATIQGSEAEPYVVTLNSCTCIDYTMRGLPCKHMYRLAQELGLQLPWPARNDAKVKKLKNNTEDELELWRKAYFCGEIAPQKYVKIVEALRALNKAIEEQ